MSKKRFVEFYLTAAVRAATLKRIERLVYIYDDQTGQERVKLYQEDGPAEIEVTGLTHVELSCRVFEYLKKSCQGFDYLEGLK